mgnify:CR=1 FL=1
MRLRLAALLILIAVAISLTGCAKLIDTQEEVVEAPIVDTRYYAGYYTYIKSGKTTITQWHPARYYTTLEYNGISTDIFGSDFIFHMSWKEWSYNSMHFNHRELR